MGRGGCQQLVLVVEDDDQVRAFLTTALRLAGHEVEEAPDGREALAKFRSLRPAVVVLDVRLPGVDGWGVLERIRQEDATAGVLMLTGSAGDERSRVRGLIAGADDYLVKPVGPAELRARVSTLLRRCGRFDRAAGGRADEVYDDGRLHVDVRRRRARVDGVELALSPTEFRLLATFAKRAGETLDRQSLLEEVWRDYSGTGGDHVKVYVGYLRRKLAAAGAGDAIETVRGFGYRYRPRARAVTG